MSVFNNSSFISFSGEPITGRVPTKTLVYGPTMNGAQYGEVAHAYMLFCNAVKVSAAGYHVQNRVFPDGTRVRMTSNCGLDTVMVWTPGERPGALDFRYWGYVLSGPTNSNYQVLYFDRNLRTKLHKLLLDKTYDLAVYGDVVYSRQVLPSDDGMSPSTVIFYELDPPNTLPVDIQVGTYRSPSGFRVGEDTLFELAATNTVAITGLLTDADVPEPWTHQGTVGVELNISGTEDSFTIAGYDYYFRELAYYTLRYSQSGRYVAGSDGVPHYTPLGPEPDPVIVNNYCALNPKTKAVTLLPYETDRYAEWLAAEGVTTPGLYVDARYKKAYFARSDTPWAVGLPISKMYRYGSPVAAAEVLLPDEPFFHRSPYPSGRYDPIKKTYVDMWRFTPNYEETLIVWTDDTLHTENIGLLPHGSTKFRVKKTATEIIAENQDLSHRPPGFSVRIIDIDPATIL